MSPGTKQCCKSPVQTHWASLARETSISAVPDEAWVKKTLKSMVWEMLHSHCTTHRQVVILQWLKPCINLVTPAGDLKVAPSLKIWFQLWESYSWAAKPRHLWKWRLIPSHNAGIILGREGEGKCSGRSSACSQADSPLEEGDKCSSGLLFSLGNANKI